MAVIGSEEYTLVDGEPTSGDAATIYEYYGSDFAVKPNMPIRRAVGDGEKTTGFVDLDGVWSRGVRLGLINQFFEFKFWASSV